MADFKSRRTTSGDVITSLFGVFLLLFSAFVACSPSTHLFGIGFALFYIAGWPGFAFVICYCLFFGFVLTFRKKVSRRFLLRVFLASLLAMAGFATWMADLAYQGSENIAGFSSFQAEMIAALRQQNGLYLARSSRGGLLGFALAGSLNASGNRALVLSLGILLSALALLLFTYPLWRMLYLRIRANLAVHKAREEKQKESAIEEPVSELDEETEGLNHTSEEDVPVFHYVRENKDDDAPLEEQKALPEEEKNKPIMETESPSLRVPSFVRAGSYRVSPNQSHPSSKPAPSLSEASPSLSHKPIRQSGLSRAYFHLAEDKAPLPSQDEAITEAAPSSSFPENVEEQAPAFVAPSFVMPKLGKEEPKEANETAANEPSAPEYPLEAAELTLTAESIAPSIEETAEQPSLEQEDVMPKEEISAPSIPQSEAAQAPMNSTPSSPVSSPKPVEDPYASIPNAEPWPPYVLPGLDLLLPSKANDPELAAAQQKEAEENIAIIDRFFADFRIGAKVAKITIGPSFTQYEIQPEPNVPVTSISSRVTDLEMRLGGISASFNEHVLGSTTCALEVPNRVRRPIAFREAYSALQPGVKMQIPFGVDIRGQVIQGNLAEFPHMLVAGTSGSGKSVFLHGVICSLLMHNRPEELRLVLVDPKGVEMAMYEKMPHLLCPIIKDPKDAVESLKRLCDEMDSRYKIMSTAHFREIGPYNEKFCKAHNKKPFPYIVCIIDEFADLMTTAKSVADSVARLTAKARSCGIHLIVATQHPSVDVISGKIKSNLDTRVALSVNSFSDSTTILNQSGAEKLLGKGDMLVMCPKIAPHRFLRCQGVYLPDEEMNAITEFISNQLPQRFDSRFLNLNVTEVEIGMMDSGYPSVSPSSNPFSASAPSGQTPQGKVRNDPKYEEVKRLVITCETYSISRMGRDFGFGFTRAGKLYRWLQEDGIVEIAETANNSKGCRVIKHSLEENEDQNSEDKLRLPDGF